MTRDLNIHFISGLPRSGSTLLAAILRQNPRFHAGMTSPVGSLFLRMLEGVSRKNEGAMFIDDRQKRDICAAPFEAYYRSSGKEIVFDTNRLWCAQLPALAQMFPDAKVVCCVREIGWIMDSIERLYRENAFDLSGIFGFDAGGTVYSRVGQLAPGNGLVGFALNALREAFYGEQADRLLLIDYEALTRQPQRTMKELYRFIGEPLFRHDFDSVEYEAMDFDLALGTPGLHTVRKKVEFIERGTILPPQLFRSFMDDAFWKRPENNTRDVKIVLP